MTPRRPARPEPARLYPWLVALDLVDAGLRRDLARIDAITDDLARAGLCRPRTDYSRFPPVDRSIT